MPKKKDSICDDVIRSLVAQDTQLWKIAELFGCAQSTIDRRMRKMGLNAKRTGPKSAERHPDWNGGVTYRKGYRYLYTPEHPNAINGRYVAEHRLVMENKLGRYLDRSEVVHHIDGNATNNSESNLMLFGSNAEHLKHELTGKTPEWTEAGKILIQEALEKAHRLLGNTTRPVFYVQEEPQPTHRHQE